MDPSRRSSMAENTPVKGDGLGRWRDLGPGSRPCEGGVGCLLMAVFLAIKLVAILYSYFAFRHVDKTAN